MRPLDETANRILCALTYIISLLMIIVGVLGAAGCAVALVAIGNADLRNHYHRDVVTPLVILVIMAIVGFFLPRFLEHFVLGKELDGSHDHYAESYYITHTCVLPHASFDLDPDGYPYQMTIRMRYQYEELLHAYREMKRRHRVCYVFHKQNIPGTNCQVQMALSRHSAKQLLNEMRQASENTEKPFLILETSIPMYSNCPLPPKMQFISRQDIAILRQRAAAAPNRQATAAIDIGLTTQMDARFLDFCDSLIYTDEQMINLPSINWALVR